MGAIGRRWAAAILAVAATGLAGCESLRFGGRGAAAGARAPGVAPAEPTVSSIPSGSVTAEPLAPPPGGGRPQAAEVMPGAPQPTEVLGTNPGAGPPAGSSRSSAIGGWTAREASGSTCRVNLSSTPSLDLYRANAAGCANKDLARITAWDFKEGEVYLYQPGGAVAARLRAGDGGLNGVLSKSGAPLALTRG